MMAVCAVSAVIHTNIHHYVWSKWTMKLLANVRYMSSSVRRL